MAQGIGYGAPDQSSHGALSVSDEITLETLQNWFRLWATATETARTKMRRDYEYTEGGGKQWRQRDREEVEKSGRPALEFNQVLPQVDLVAGIQRGMELDFTTMPRGFEDRRLSEVCNGSLRAVKDFARIQRVSDRVFDDGIISGLGVWKITHTFDDAEDMVWGDIEVTRLNPLAFIYDPWSTQADLQDGVFMGDAAWIDVQTFRDRYPTQRQWAVPGEWLSRWQSYIGDSTDLGTGANLQAELFDVDTGRIRVLNLWYKVPSEVSLIVDIQTGQVRDVPSKAAGQQELAAMAEAHGRRSIESLQVIQSDAESLVVDLASGQPVPDQSGMAPMTFINPETAQAFLDEQARRAGMQVYERFRVVTRKARVPRWCELCWWTILDQGPTPYADRLFPYVPYISRRISDDPEGIIGIVRNLHHPQDEYNKRISNTLAHLNSSSHSGWLNPKAGGADTVQLQQMGSKPGVVVEFGSSPPLPIKPSELSSGHFQLVQNSERQILRISGVNAEMIGFTTQQTVSGRAIRARQEGGSTILKPRFRAFEESQLDVTRLLLSRIKQYYPPEKLRRIIGTVEQNGPLGPTGLPLFADPVTGQPMPEDQILALLGRMQNTDFDVILRMEPASASERQAQLERALQAAKVITDTGRPLGPNTIAALVDMADLPTRLVEGLRRDAAAPPDPLIAAQQGKGLEGSIANARGGRAGGSEGVVGQSQNALQGSGQGAAT